MWATEPDQAEAFGRVASAVAASRYAEDWVDTVAAVIAELYSSLCMVGLVSADSESVHPLGIHHPDPELRSLTQDMLGVPFPRDSGIIGDAVAQGHGVVGRLSPEELVELRPTASGLVKRYPIDQILSVPIQRGEHLLGALWLARRDGEPDFTADDVDFTEAVAGVLALAIENTFLEEALKQAAGRRQPQLTWRRRPDEEGGERRQAAPHELSEREQHILKLLADGFTNREVGEDLNLSVRTVEWHRQRIQWKLGADGRAELVQAYKQLGLP
jgi:DNA-binding CsgD family transcriptional regulator